jgi:hypothetical protein
MITIDTNILTSMGITLPANQEADFLNYLYATLEERVGYAVTELLDDAEFDELIELQEHADDATVEAWVLQHVPDLAAVIQDEFDILMGELAENADSLVRV